MIVEPKVREFICTTAHPEGMPGKCEKADCICEGKGPGMRTEKGTGNRCFHRIWTGRTELRRLLHVRQLTIGIMFEKPSNGKRTATPGWYNTAS